MAIGIIGVSILFVLVSGNLFSYQTETVTGATEQVVADDLKTIIETVASHQGTSNYWYDVPIPDYRLETINQSIVMIYSGGASYGRRISAPITLADVTIEDADTLCVQKEPGTITLAEGNCEYLTP